jgi:hypothetical protein
VSEGLVSQRISCYSAVKESIRDMAMDKDLDMPTESSEQKATRMWKNHQLRNKYKENKMPVVAVVDPENIDYVNKKIRLPKTSPPEVGTVIETEKPRVESVRRFEDKFRKEIKSILSEHKERTIEAYRAIIQHQRRQLLLEKIRRLEASIAQKQKAIDLKQRDLFG